MFSLGYEGTKNKEKEYDKYKEHVYSLISFRKV